jgi:glycosyltransferase involved in cell wall biosynthesis
LINLIRAFELLKSPVSLVIAGRAGWKYREILQAIKFSSKTGRIHYLGYVPEQHKPALISLAKALVYPSFYEGFGFQPLEAMACGVPTVASQVSSLPEVVGDASLLADPYSPESLARALDIVLADGAASGEAGPKRPGRRQEI